jgi:hypothetical protein
MSRGVALSLAFLVGVQSLAAAPTITHTPLACLSAETNARITAHVEGQPSSVRVYFHAIGQTSCGEYYVDMRRDARDPTLYTAILPIPTPDADVVMYQIRAKVSGGAETAIAPVAATIRKECTLPALAGPDLQAAQSIVLGFTQASQKPVPCRFRCNGLTNYITAAGEMKPNEECRLLLAGLAGKGPALPWYRTPAAEIAAGAVVGAGTGLALDNGRNHRAPSPARP